MDKIYYGTWYEIQFFKVRKDIDSLPIRQQEIIDRKCLSNPNDKMRHFFKSVNEATHYASTYQVGEDGFNRLTLNIFKGGERFREAHKIYCWRGSAWSARGQNETVPFPSIFDVQLMHILPGAIFINRRETTAYVPEGCGNGIFYRIEIRTKEFGPIMVAWAKDISRFKNDLVADTELLNFFQRNCVRSAIISKFSNGVDTAETEWVYNYVK